MSYAPSFARRFLPVWGFGFFGIAALLLQPVPAALLLKAPALQEMPEIVVRLMMIMNPLILLTAMAALGAALAHRSGLRSALAGDAEARLSCRTAVVLGLAVALVVWFIDAATADLLGPAWNGASGEAASDPAFSGLLLGALYGGLTEEVMLRWGLMSFVIWSVTRLLPSGPIISTQATHFAAWTGIWISATVFAAGHLPFLAQSVELTGPIVARTIGLNMFGGVVYGWLFWRRSLESSMLAHATTHVGFAMGRWLS